MHVVCIRYHNIPRICAVVGIKCTPALAAGTYFCWLQIGKRTSNSGVWILWDYICPLGIACLSFLISRAAQEASVAAADQCERVSFNPYCVFGAALVSESIAAQERAALSTRLARSSFSFAAASWALSRTKSILRRDDEWYLCLLPCSHETVLCASPISGKFVSFAGLKSMRHVRVSLTYTQT